MYKPGKSLELIHVNDKTILIEICREHVFPIPDSVEKADIHIILSDSINFNSQKYTGISLSIQIVFIR